MNTITVPLDPATTGPTLNVTAAAGPVPRVTPCVVANVLWGVTLVAVIAFLVWRMTRGGGRRVVGGSAPVVLPLPPVPGAKKQKKPAAPAAPAEPPAAAADVPEAKAAEE